MKVIWSLIAQDQLRQAADYIENSVIEIVALWDTRREPKKLNDGL